MPLLAVAFADHQPHLLGVSLHQPTLAHLDSGVGVPGLGQSSTVSVSRTLYHL